MPFPESAQMTHDTSPADTPDLGLHDPLAESFPQSLQGRILFWIAVIFSLYQIATAAHLLNLERPDEVSRLIASFARRHHPDQSAAQPADA